jgi:hypothetical protein
MNTKTATICCLLGLALPIAASAGARPDIAWDANRLLTWDDFAGPVATGVHAKQVAATAASLGWAYHYRVEQSNGSCVYRITDIRVSAVFDPNRSWVKPGHETAAVLAHEQGHFDIAQIHKLMFDDMTREFVGTARKCKGESAKRIAKFVDNDIARSLGDLYEQVWEQHTEAQETYDSATNHGTHAAAQEQWLARIAAGLRNHGWD